MNYGQVRNATFGGILLLVSGGMLFMQMSRSSWPEVEAKVSSVALTCMMKATERGVLTKTTSTAEIDCDDVESFKRFYPDLSWTTTERFAAVLSIRNGGTVTKATMDLQRVDGRAPHAGDVITVIQDPKRPTTVAKAGQSGMNFSISAVTGALGLLLLYLAFRKPKPKPLDAATIALAHEIVAAAAAQQQGPVLATATAAGAAAYRPSNPDPIQPGRRAFGRRGA